ncbi:hypothetical protein C942_02536 [Photobacterium marinum]|uniref:Uncharacterized protein n=1 Tax=Photobacterium marinum TaxID=1056511 RepID=L8J6C9_9GAMM|nr:hypothetical protein C942_02536 [Photobacterium marinum]
MAGLIIFLLAKMISFVANLTMLAMILMKMNEWKSTKNCVISLG